MVNTKAKGDRNEREVVEIYEEAGWDVETPNSTPYPQSYGVDFFGLFDFMAFKEGKKPVFGQVKSNRASGIRSFIDECEEIGFPFEYANIEFCVRHDGDGWRVFEMSREGRQKVVDERDSDCNIGEEYEEYVRGR